MDIKKFGKSALKTAAAFPVPVGPMAGLGKKAMGEKKMAIAKRKTQEKLKNYKKSMPITAGKKVKPTQPAEGVQRLKNLSRLGNTSVLGKMMGDRLIEKKKKKDAAGSEWSRFRRESPSTGKGVGY